MGCREVEQLENFASDAVMIRAGAVSGPIQLDIEDIEDAGGAGGEYGNPVADVHGLIHVVGDKEDRVFSFFPEG